jgi:competence protein ComEA
MSDQVHNTHGEKAPPRDDDADPSRSEIGGPIRETKRPEDLNPRPPDVAASRGPFPFRFRDQLLLAVACAVALLFMAIYCVRTSNWGTDPIELDRQPQHELDYKIDLNSATWVEWSQLPTIGEILAKRIVDDREQNGPFRDIDDLGRVTGIGPMKIEAIRPFIRTGALGGPTEPASDLPEQIGSIKSP